MGGSQSHEFMVASEAGEDYVVQCRQCGYSANLEKAVSVASAPAAGDPEGDREPEEFHTPGRKTIAEVAEFTGLPETSQMKSLVMVADGKPVLALLRGDHQLSETKFAGVTGSAEIRAAHPEEIRNWFGADAGSLGPLGVNKMRVVADQALAGRRNMISGANKDDYHLRHVTPGEDFQPEFADLRQVAAGDVCATCGSAVQLMKTVEIGHIFKLGYKYSEAMGLRVLNEAGVEVTPIMGSYGIGIERILSSAIELYHDKDGMALPPPIAPFQVVITPVNFSDAALRTAAEQVYRECRELGLDALLDDRDERPGVKFKDADLIGIPYRITIGKKLAQGSVEAVERRTKASSDVRVAEAARFVAGKVHGS
jgi:prolyl-tRNA synthetase